MLRFDDTICAIASAPGGATRGIVRLSGPQVLETLVACFRPSDDATLSQVSMASVVSGELLMAPPLGDLPGDLFYWPSERSYSRQPTAEFHTFGSPPLLAATVRAFCNAGARPAEPGEFTLRAFLAGRLDLTQAEAVLGVIDANGRRPLETALAQLAGGLSRPLSELRETLLELLAHLEAGLDFVEEDIQFISRPTIDEALARAAMTVKAIVEQLQTRTAANELPRVVLVGLPNVGKSSLFNALVGRLAAIVSPRPGTTRDYLTTVIELAGQRCELIDTAGIDAALSGGIERSAQEATAAQRESASVTLFCLDCTRAMESAEREGLANADQAIIVLTKCDEPRKTDFQSSSALETSATTAAGLDELAAAIRRAICDSAANVAVAGTAERCGDSLRRAGESLDRAQYLNTAGGGEELIAAELRSVLAELGKVVGAVYTEDILDRIFSRFCIGK